MKIYLLLLPLLFLTSCSQTEESSIDYNGMTARIGIIDTIPINKNNPYDNAGQEHYALLLDYYYGDYTYTSVDSIISSVTQLANVSDDFKNLTDSLPYVFTAQNETAYIIDKGSAAMDSVINTSLETTQCRTLLKDFLNGLLITVETEDDYAALHPVIVDFENQILEDATISASEKKTILITTSITRHSVYARKKKPKKNKDPDWAYLVTNVIGALDGADNGADEAVMRGLVCGIVGNSK